MTTTDDLSLRLATLERVRYDLISGKSAVSVGSAGRSVAYAKADLAALNAEIAGLRRRLGLAGGRRAIPVIF